MRTLYAIFDKIVSYLAAREGFKYDPMTLSKDGNTVRTVVTDAFGFRYEVEIKLIGRLYDGQA